MVAATVNDKKASPEAATPDPAEGLNGRQRRFTELVVANPDKSLTECYRAAGYNPQNDAAAMSAASRLWSHVKVRAYARWLRREAMRPFLDQATTWAELEVAARDYLEGVLDGRYAPNRQKIDAAKYIADRALGKPRQAIDHTVSDADTAIKELSEELAEIDQRLAEEDEA